MNIFYLHQDPHEAAKVQYNKHVVKMILESAQMLCTAHHCVMGEDADVPYKAAHIKTIHQLYGLGDQLTTMNGYTIIL